MKKRTGEILELLDEKYGTEFICYLNYETPWQLLIATMLSAQCTDARVNIVTKELFQKYKGVTEDDLVENLRHFLRRIAPVSEDCGIKMAIHPDDPPWGIFGLPRIIKNTADLERLLSLVDSDINGITFCTGSLGASKDNDLPAMIRKFGDRIYFAHLRNVLRRDGWFNETSHLSSDGSLDMYEIVKALYESGFDGYIRPDHGRMLWGEKARPGYGLYDRALGAAYINGLWEAVSKSEREGR